MGVVARKKSFFVMEIYTVDIATRSVTTQCVWLKNLLMEMMRNIYWREEKGRSSKTGPEEHKLAVICVYADI
jgi:hypothetical protein